MIVLLDQVGKKKGRVWVINISGSFSKKINISGWN
jgi:hypothetical protein